MRSFLAGCVVLFAVIMPRPVRATPAQQAALDAALTGFPFTAAEREACARDYSFALGFADLPDSLPLYVGVLKGCVLGERARQRDAEARKLTARAAAATKLVEEQKQEDERRAASAEEARLNAAAETMAAKPAVAQAILSAFLCDSEKARGEKLQAIAKDRKYSAAGGAVDLRRRLELQDELRALDDRIVAVKGSLRSIKRPALACNSAQVMAMGACLWDEEETEDCKAVSAVLARAAKLLDPAD